MIEIKNVTKKYGDKCAVDNVSFNVNEENCDLVNSIIKENSASRNYDLIRIIISNI